MKKSIKVTDANGKITCGEVNIRNLDHFNVQLHTKAGVYKTKKGKGSYRRNKKVSPDEME